jgi:hypothetical protein
MDPWKQPANTAFSYPHRFLPDNYHRGYSLAPIFPQQTYNWNLPIPEFNINYVDTMSTVQKQSKPATKRGKKTS